MKVSLVCQGRRIKKRKTSVKKASLCPVYNEALVFDVPAQNVDDVSLLIKVLDYDRLVPPWSLPGHSETPALWVIL